MKGNMSKVSPKEERHILPEMTILDVVCRYRGSEAIFRKYDEQAGAFICCRAHFETLRDVRLQTSASYRLTRSNPGLKKAYGSQASIIRLK